MDSASLKSLTPLLDGIDRWVELAPLLPVIVALELVLSADNAIALASIARGLDNEEFQKNALNIGIAISLFLRILLILFAQYVLDFWPAQFAAGIYLVLIFLLKLRDQNTNLQEDNPKKIRTSFIGVVSLLAITDLAFSIDSVTAAVSISDQFLLVITGAVIGVFALRFTSGVFIRWISEYPRLELAGYIAICLVGIKLLVLLAFPLLLLPDWLTLLVVFLLFAWGFSLSDS